MSEPTFSKVSGEPLEVEPIPHWWQWRKRQQAAERRVEEKLREFKEAVNEFTDIVEDRPEEVER